MARKGQNASWTQAMVERLYALTADKVGATQTAIIMNREFGMQLSRNSVLGRLHRDRIAGKAVPAGLGVGGTDPHAAPAAIARPKVKPRKDAWRKDDERWLLGLTMLKDGHSAKSVAITLRVPEDEVRGKLRSIVADDIKHGDGSLEDWAWLELN